MAVELELEAIEDVSALAGGFPAAAECKPFEADKVQEIAQNLVPSIQKILTGDAQELDALYAEDGFWRDQVALAWTFRTFQSKA